MKRAVIVVLSLTLLMSGCSLSKKQQQDTINEGNQLQQEADDFKAADAAIESWARAVKERDGKQQYALLSDQLQQQTKDKYEELGWVTGVSSPWVSEYEISEIEKVDEEVTYEVKFQLETSTGKAGETIARVHVVKQTDAWRITEIEASDDGLFLP